MKISLDRYVWSVYRDPNNSEFISCHFNGSILLGPDLILTLNSDFGQDQFKKQKKCKIIHCFYVMNEWRAKIIIQRLPFIVVDCLNLWIEATSVELVSKSRVLLIVSMININQFNDWMKCRCSEWGYYLLDYYAHQKKKQPIRSALLRAHWEIES